MSIPPDLTSRVEALADLLAGQGELHDPRWRRALHDVPRHVFVPRLAWADPDGPQPGYAVDRGGDPDAWWEAVYSDTALVTQFDDGASDVRAGRGVASCSCSAPGAVFSFFHHLDVHSHHRVLEIGTGTGWTAALLSWRTRIDITSMEIDEQLSACASANLKTLGYSPNVIVADGAAGWPSGAPYDRVHATCAVTKIPYAWVQQTRVGGVIVAPLSPGFGYGHLAVLTVLADGSAVGRFPEAAGYMLMRAQRPAVGDAFDWVADKHDPIESSTELDPRPIFYAPRAANLMSSTLVPGVQRRIYHDRDGYSGECTFWALESAGPGGSWASVDYVPGRDEFVAQQYGERRLWDEVSHAYLRWLQHGRPGIDRFGITISESGACVWLDDPANAVGCGA